MKINGSGRPSMSHWHYADETERRKWQDPEALLAEIGLRAGMIFMDIGCGEGFFTLPAARSVGDSGQAYGLDIEAEAIEEIRREAAAEGLQNLSLTVGPAEKSVLCRSCADIVFFGIVLHDFQNPSQVLQNARKMIKADGQLVNLDWKKEPLDFGPPFAKRFSESTAAKLIESAGFRVENIRNSGQYHYLIIARPV
jgi:ubiquinone/menaquinone biosynthesis C-methylase UbiE